MSAVADKLREARALVERGWTRGEYCRDGRVCARGALNAAFNGSPDEWLGTRAQLAAERILKDAIGRNNIVQWNDTQKSKKPILAAFDRAIELAESEQ